MDLATKISFKVILNFWYTPLGLLWISAIAFILIGHIYNLLANSKKDGLKTASNFFKEFFLYGQKYTDANEKSKSNGNRERKSIYSIQVPKRWFFHFYVVSALVNCFLWYTAYRAYFLRRKCPAILLTIIDLFTFDIYSYQKPYFVNTDQTSAIIILTCLTIQGCRRLYECRLISVYSDSSIHVAHYLMGLFFYSFQGITILIGAPHIYSVRLRAGELELKQRHYVGVAVFLVASAIQFQSHVLLANLRKKDKVKAQDHGVATGGMFRFVSSPNLMAECMIYIAIYYIGGVHHVSAALVCAFVVVNQTLSAILTHQWYKTRFASYPSNRKAIIPFVL